MKRKKLIWIAGLSVLLVACTSGAENHRFKPFVPSNAMVTGIPACDTYFSLLEVCLKQQVTSNQYQDLEAGLAEAKQSIIYLNDPEYAARSCNEALEEAKKAYASKGCTFD